MLWFNYLVVDSLLGLGSVIVEINLLSFEFLGENKVIIPLEFESFECHWDPTFSELLISKVSYSFWI